MVPPTPYGRLSGPSMKWGLCRRFIKDGRPKCKRGGEVCMHADEEYFDGLRLQRHAAFENRNLPVPAPLCGGFPAAGGCQRQRQQLLRGLVQG